MSLENAIYAMFAAGGGGAAIAFLIFKFIGVAWLEARFAEKLETFRTEKAIELERFKAEIDGTMRAQLRYNEKEFECIVEVWVKLRKALKEIASCVSMFQTYADISRMTDAKRAEYLASLEILEADRREIIAHHDPQARFVKIMNGIRFGVAANAFNDFYDYLRSVEIFVDESIYKKITDISDGMHSILVEKDLDLGDRHPKEMLKAFKDYQNNCLPMVAELTTLIRSRTFAGHSK